MRRRILIVRPLWLWPTATLSLCVRLPAHDCATMVTMSKSTQLMALLALCSIAGVALAKKPVNLLANGGLEKDSDKDGVPDGWLSHPHHFSRESLQHVQQYIKQLPSHKQLIAGKDVRGSDGWVLQARDSKGKWGPFIKSAEFYKRMSQEYLPQNSRFGQLPVPKGLMLSKTTMVIHNQRPHQQTISKPITVKPNTGYRLSFWFRMSGGSEEAIFQVLGVGAPRNNAWPTSSNKDKRQVISYLSLGWSWVPYWQRYEIAFRTRSKETAIQLRPWKYYRGYDDRRRAWFDDFRLVEDNSVREGSTNQSVNPRPTWPKAVVDRGFAVVPRPTLPLTYDDYQPRAEEIDRPFVIKAAPGQIASGVLFVRAVKDLKGPLVIGLKGRPQLNGPYGAFLWAQRLVEFRVCHPLKIRKTFQQWEMRPHYLMPGPRKKPISNYTRTVELPVPKGEGRSTWVTVSVPKGTPAGDYKGEIHVVAPGKTYVGYEQKTGKNDGFSIPFIVRVRALKLDVPDVAFGMYAHTSREGKSSQLPLSVDHRAYIDQRRHGMTAVDQGGGPVFRYKDANGKFRYNFSAFDYDMEKLKRAGFTRSFHYYAGGHAMKSDVQLAILKRCRDKGYPEPIFYVFDEPGARGKELLPEMEKYFGAARKKGLKTVTAGLDWRTQAEAYDVWILDVSQIGSEDWPKIKARAAKVGAELCAYDCSQFINTHPENIRFYTGLWTWAAKLNGNWIWEYGAGSPGAPSHAFSLSDTTPPKQWSQYGFAFSIPSGWAACTSWEARRDGVNDFRYLQTLERAITKARKAGKSDVPSVVAGQEYLDKLRARVPLNAFSLRNRDSTSQKQFRRVAPGIRSKEYDAIQEQCSIHLLAIRKAQIQARRASK